MKPDTPVTSTSGAEEEPDSAGAAADGAAATGVVASAMMK